MNKKDRLEAIIRYYSNGMPSVFAKWIGVAPSTISSWLSRGTFDYDLIFAKCENISSDWLLSGEGKMLRNDISISSESQPKAKQVLITPPEESIIYNMYKEKDAENRELLIEIGRLKERLHSYESEYPNFKKPAKDVSTKEISSPDSLHATSATARLKKR